MGRGLGPHGSESANAEGQSACWAFEFSDIYKSLIDRRLSSRVKLWYLSSSWVVNVSVSSITFYVFKYILCK